MNYYKHIWNGSERSRRKSLTIHVRLFFYMWKTFFSKSIIFKVERNVLITKKDGSEAEVQVIRWNNYMIEKSRNIWCCWEDHQLKTTFPIPDTVSWQTKDGRNCGEIVAVLLCIRTALLFGLSAYPREWRPQSCTEIGVARPCCFHGSCRGSRGHMFQNHNLARLKAGLRSTLWWNMWLSCIAWCIAWW